VTPPTPMFVDTSEMIAMRMDPRGVLAGDQCQELDLLSWWPMASPRQRPILIQLRRYHRPA